MLTRSVNTLIGLFIKETVKASALGNLLHGLHYYLVMVHCDIGSFVNRCKLMLGRSNLVVLGLGCNTEFPEFKVEVLHERSDSFSYRTEIVIVHLLTLVCGGSEKSSSCKNHVRTSEILCPVYKEILLFRSYRGSNLGSLGIAEESYDTECLL